jgi:hypothetical protein
VSAKRFLAVLAVGLMGCSDGGTWSDVDPMRGTWTLTAVNGADLPFAEGSPYTGAMVVGGSIRVIGAGSEPATMRICVQGRTSPGEDPFGYVRDGSSVTVIYNLGAARTPDSATLSGSTLTIPRHFEPDHRVYTFTKTSDEPALLPC